MDALKAEVPIVHHFPGLPYAPAYAALMFHADGAEGQPGCERCTSALKTPQAQCSDFCEAGHQTVHTVEGIMHDTAQAAWWN